MPLRFLLTTLWVLLASSCADEGSGEVQGPPGPKLPGKPDVVIITVDTLRADHLGCYGYFRETSPHIDALARESLVFESCLAPMATTLPTHTSLFTATWPIEHGVLANVIDPADKERLIGKSPNNVVAIDLPFAPAKKAGPDELYERSAATLKKWLKAGVLVQDDSPAFYVYHQRFTCLCLLAFVDPPWVGRAA